ISKPSALQVADRIARGTRASVAGFPDPLTWRSTASPRRDVAHSPEFDDFHHDIAARLALERALVMIRPVGLNARQPHRRAASLAGRMSNFNFIRVEMKFAHGATPRKSKNYGPAWVYRLSFCGLSRK